MNDLSQVIHKYYHRPLTIVIDLRVLKVYSYTVQVFTYIILVFTFEGVFTHTLRLYLLYLPFYCARNCCARFCYARICFARFCLRDFHRKPNSLYISLKSKNHENLKLAVQTNVIIEFWMIKSTFLPIFTNIRRETDFLARLYICIYIYTVYIILPINYIRFVEF